MIACGQPSAAATGTAESALGEAEPVASLDYTNPRIRPITLPENITDLSYGADPRGRVRTDFAETSAPRVFDVFSLSVRHMGGPCLPTRSSTCDQSNAAVANPIHWDVGLLTGFRPPAPVHAWQFGAWEAGPEVGANAFQLHGTSAGMHINTWSFDHTHPVIGGGPNAVYEINYSTPRAVFNTPTSELTLQAYVRLPWAASWNGGIGQLSFYCYFRDRSTSRLFAYVFQIWDSRAPGDGNGSEFIGHDTQVSFVSSPLLPGMRYSTVSPYSNHARNQHAWTSLDFFRVHVSGQKLIAAARAIDAAHGTNLSKTPSDYELVGAGILQEVFVGTDPQTNMSMAASVTDFAVYEFH